MKDITLILSHSVKFFFLFRISLLFICTMMWFPFAAQPVPGKGVFNANPDQEGDPWLVCEKIELTRKQQDLYYSIPFISAEKAQANLPAVIDNSQQPFFRSIFQQDDGACGQASGIAYTFTYEMNYVRNIPSVDSTNLYPTHFTYNFLNFGSGNMGTLYLDGWNILRYTGCPNISDYKGLAAIGDRGWMTGYEKYHRALNNKVYDIYAIDVKTPEGLNALKSWLYNHMNGVAVDAGGLAVFAAGVVFGTYTYKALPPGTPEAGKKVVVKWDSVMNHQMTIVGYNDSIRYDYNGDGFFTNNIDLNNDGNINMSDWEIGGLIFANSWGTTWGNHGKCYMMYKTLADPIENGGIMESRVHILKVKAVSTPLVCAKVKLKYNYRDRIRIALGVSPDTIADHPQFIAPCPIFDFQGGENNMQGYNGEEQKTIEIGLDATPLLEYFSPGQPLKIFLVVVENDPDNIGEGEIISYSLMDYSGQTTEIICPDVFEPVNQGDTTYLSVNRIPAAAPPEIITADLPVALPGAPYSHQFIGSGGTQPYNWKWEIPYQQQVIQQYYPDGQDSLLQLSSTFWGKLVFKLPFSFPFYGKMHDSATLLTDATILFNNDHIPIYTNQSIMSYQSIVAYGWYSEIYPSSGEGVWYSGNPDSASFRWKSHVAGVTSYNIDCVITLFRNGMIKISYHSDIIPLFGWCSGISKGDGFNFEISNLSNSVESGGKTVSFIPPSIPTGVDLSPEGVFQGIPDVGAGSYELIFSLLDANNFRVSKLITFVVETNDIHPEGLSTNLKVNGEFRENQIYLFISGLKNSAEIRIYDISGKTLFKKTAVPSNQATDIILAPVHLTKGVYIISITNKEHIFIKKFIF